MDLIDKTRPLATIVLGLMLAALTALCGCQVHQGHDPSWNPFRPCPSGQVRVKDVTRPAGQQWVCE